jgi:methylmalonyl-CoA/ethylmalonyl-CoA epimerase
MIGRLNHVAIAVADLKAAAALYKQKFGANVSEPQPVQEHGVTVVFVELPNTKIELLEPLGENSPIAGFVKNNPKGGIHHVCYEVPDVTAAAEKLKAEGMRVLGQPKLGAHNNPVIFLHPSDSLGTLVELEQTPVV